MQVEQELASLSPQKDTLLTIGVFDGVHLGHKYLLAQLTRHARRQNLLSGVVTFRQHPQEMMSPQARLPFLTDLIQRINLLKGEGIDLVVPLSFTRELARLTARQFVSRLKKYLRMRGLVIGHDFALGQKREGNDDTLRALGKEMGFSVEVVAARQINGEIVSSTAIREALAVGDMGRVHNLTGRNFGFCGRVVTGVGRGIELGFPTANLEVAPRQALPADGVYATWAYIGDQAYQSMTNIGKRPTFGDNQRTIEVYILNYQNNLYGHEVRIDVIDRLRSEKRFDSARELKEQIAEDIERGRVILSRQAGN